MTRYEPAINGTVFMGMYSHATGEWVRYEDAQAAVAQARGNLSLAEEGLANAMQEIEAAKHDIERLQAAASAEANEVERLKAALERIQQERLTWAMVCICGCSCCCALDAAIRGEAPHG